MSDSQIPAVCDLLRVLLEHGVKEFSYLNLEGIARCVQSLLDNALSAAGVSVLTRSIRVCREQGMNVDFSLIRCIRSRL